MVGPSNTVAPIVKQAHSENCKPLFVTVSFVDTDDLIQAAGPDAEGMVITQVVPPYYLTDFKTVALLPAHHAEVHAQRAAELRQPGRFRGRHGNGGGPEKGRQGADP